MQTISLEGIIGAGKSTALKIIQDEFEDVCVVYEPVAKWEKVGILKQFYEDMHQHSYTFQTYTYITRLQAIRDALNEYRLQHRRDPKYLFLERSIFSDRYFFVEMLVEDQYMTEMQQRMYEDWWDMWKELMPVSIDKFIYIRPELEVCMDRVKTRNRDGENELDVEYQKRLMDKHDKFFITQNMSNDIHNYIISIDDDFRTGEGKQKLIGYLKNILC